MKCAYCGKDSSNQGHAMKDDRGWFFECDPKNTKRAEAVLCRIIDVMNNRKRHQFSAYNGRTESYVTKVKRHGR